MWEERGRQTEESMGEGGGAGKANIPNPNATFCFSLLAPLPFLVFYVNFLLSPFSLSPIISFLLRVLRVRKYEIIDNNVNVRKKRWRSVVERERKKKTN